MEKYFCIHGHFYQPPRENPWLEEIEVQSSASPYHDWNEKISAECYAPNSASRIMNGKNQILKIINNYEKISFNFGPTLLSWLKKYEQETYNRIVEADRISQQERGGHGNAIAQVYNHIIMPLASPRDQRTEIIWAIKDFEHHFHRKPEGMWLAETAVNLDVLQRLSEEGIKFTILAPHQARRIRKIGAQEWMDVNQGNIDPTLPYQCFLKDGRSIALFFYDAPISFSIAFDRVLVSGDYFVQRIMKGFNDARVWPQILHLATDGESYGHHFKFGEMALTYALDYIERNHIAQLTNYGEYLERHPPKFQVEILENTSWSCAHGIQRWCADCGCNSGKHRGWNQRWRRPLREGLDNLKTVLDDIFEREGIRYLYHPWRARDDYIEVILDRSHEHIERFLARHSRRPLQAAETVQVLKLMEMQRCGLLMFTSCGWFFDDISGIESVQILKYAARAIQLAQEMEVPDAGQSFLDKLAEAQSNIPQMGTGADIFKKIIRPSQVDFQKVLTHYAINSLFEDYAYDQEIYSYQIVRKDFDKKKVDSSNLAIGRVIASSRLTLEAHEATFAVFHSAGFNLRCYIAHPSPDQEKYTCIKENLLTVFNNSDAEIINKTIGEHFGTNYLTLRELFLEERIKITSLINRHVMKNFTETYHNLYHEYSQIMNDLREVEVPIPKGFLVATEYSLYGEMVEGIKNFSTLNGNGTWEWILGIVEQAERWEVKLSTPEVELLIRRQLERKIRSLAENPFIENPLAIHWLFELAKKIQLRLNLWQMQNHFQNLLTSYPGILQLGAFEGKLPPEKIEMLQQLGKTLQFNVD
ncbi:MAG: DUF3536 domain-containing protein [bacterium]